MAKCNGRHHRRHKRNDRIIDADEILKKSGFKTPGPEVLRHQAEQLVGEELLARSNTQFGPLSTSRKIMDAGKLCELSGDAKPTDEELRQQIERLEMQKSTIMARRLGIGD